MELRENLAVIRRWWWLILLGVVLAGGAGYMASRSMPQIYQTRTTLMIGRSIIQSPNPNVSELSTIQQLGQSYAEMIRRQPILQATAEALGLGMDWRELREKVSASLVPGTQLLEISVSDTDPQRAKAIVDELARQLILQSPTEPEKEQEWYREFVKTQLADLQARISDAQQQIKDLQAALDIETTAEGIRKRQEEINALQAKLNIWQANYASLLSIVQGSSVNYLTVIEPAIVPTTPVSPKIEMNILLAAAFGLILTVAGAFFLEYLDDTVKTTDDAQRVLSLPTLGAITHIAPIKEPRDHVATAHHPRSPIAEAYRVLRTNIQFSSLTNPSATLLVTSAGPGEGKSTTAANLAVAMAQAGKRVILADTDLRRPAMHRFFEVPNNVGVTNLLLDENLDLETALARTGVDGLRVLTSGPLPPNPAELLGSPQMQKLIARLKEQADVVIFDSPPVLAVTDASVLAARVGATLLVIDAGRTRSEVCRRGKERLEQVGVKLLGVVLNKLSQKRAAGYYYYYYYYSSDDGQERRKKRQRK